MEAIWKTSPKLEVINRMGQNTLVSHLGITFVEVGHDYLKATMPVDSRTVQPMGLLHGGASVALAETMGSVASFLCLGDLSQQAAVGLEINANHLRPATSGLVTGTCSPIKLGRSMHVWRIVIHGTDGKQICESRITIAIVSQR